MLCTIEQFFINLRVRHHFGWIEQAQLHSRRKEPNQRRIDFALFQNSLFIGIKVWSVIVVVFYLGEKIHAFVVHTTPQRQRGGFGLGLGEVMISKNVQNCAAIRDNIAIELPFAAQLVLKKKLI